MNILLNPTVLVLISCVLVIGLLFSVYYFAGDDVPVSLLFSNPVKYFKTRRVIDVIDEKLDESSLEDSIFPDALDIDEDGMLEEELKFKVITGDSEEEVNQKWIKFKKERTNDLPRPGDIVRIKKSKMTYSKADNSYQLSIKYWEAVLVEGAKMEDFNKHYRKHTEAVELEKKLQKFREDILGGIIDVDTIDEGKFKLSIGVRG